MDNTTMDTLVINIESTSTDATSAIDRLTKSLENLQSALSSVVSASKGLSNLRNISKVASGTNIKAKQPEKMQKIMSGVQVSPAFDALSTGNLEVNKSMSNLIVGYNELGNVLKNMETSYDQLIPISTIQQGRNEMQKLKTTSGEVVTVTKKMKNGFATFHTSVKTTSPSVQTLSDKLSTMQKIMSTVQFKALAIGTALINMAKKAVGFVETASAEAEALNLFTVTMGKYAQQGTEWIERFSDALYLDPVSVMQYMGSFNSLVKGLGVGAENSYIMSQNLTQLVYDLSSFKNISIESAYEKLMSGISGELEPLRNVGVAMSEATLQTLAYELGIDKLVREMTEAEKAQLRYIQIMRSTTEWQTDMGRTIITPANALRVMKQQFIQLGRAIGKVFIPIVMKLMPYVIALTQLLTTFATKLANLLGYEIADIDYSGLENISAGIGKISDRAEDAKNKLNTMLAPFDDLNVVQKKTESAGSGLSGIGGDLGVALPVYDALANLNTKFAEGVERAKENLGSIVPVLGVLATVFAGIKIGKNVLSFLKFIESAKAVPGVVKLVGVLGGTGGLAIILIGIGLTVGALLKELPKLSKAFDDVVFNGKKITEVAKEFSAFDKFLLSFLASNPIGQFGLSILGVIKGVQYFRNEVIESKDIIKELGDDISEASQANLKPLISQFETLNSTITDFKLKDQIISDEDVAEIKNNIADIVNTITTQLSVDKNQQIANLDTLKNALGVDNYSSILSDIKGFYSTQQEIININSAKINEILETARNEGRALEEADYAEINRLRTEMMETGITMATASSDEYYLVMSKLKNNLVALSTEQASQYIQDAAKTRDETIKAAEEQYYGILAEAEKLRTVGAIGDEEYERIRQAAEQTYRETVDDASAQYSEIYYITTKKLGENAKYIDEETGEIKSNWEMFTDDLNEAWDKMWVSIGNTLDKKWGDIKKWYDEDIKPIFTKKYWTDLFDKMVQGASEKLTELKEMFESWMPKIKTPEFKWVEGGIKATGWMKDALEALNLPTSIPKLQVKWYQDGGYPTSGDLFFANENGIPEMVGRIGNQTAVANNDQIATSITNALLTALDQYDFGGGKSPTTIYIGNKKVYEGYGDYASEENDRYGTNVIKI